MTGCSGSTALVGDDHAGFVAARAHDGTDREERHRGNERLHQRGVELSAGEPGEHEARLLGLPGVLIRAGAGHRFVDVGDGDELAHEMRHALAELGIAAPLHAAMVLERDGRRQRAQAVDLDQDLRAERRVRLHQRTLALVERAQACG